MANILDWIEVKRIGKELDEEALEAIVSGFTTGQIPDYQMSAWLMAVTINGMTLDETCALTDAMLQSGSTLDVLSLPGPTIDKHSSGGVGDKVTLALVPMLAASGAYVAKMSGHGLGLTGGTLDKLESVPGLRTQLTTTEILRQVGEIGACLCAQSDTLAPADRVIYALRDVTGTVASIPLIASSIMSKKLACGAGALLLDIKVGSGAFMQDLSSAKELGQTCRTIAERHGKACTVVLSDMNQPLGRAVGNAIELREAAALITPGAASGEARLTELTSRLFSEASCLLGWDGTSSGKSVLGSGEASRKLSQVIGAQHGNFAFFKAAGPLENLDAFVRQSWRSGVVVAERSGIVSRLDAAQVARCSAVLGASRERKGDAVDYEAGIWLAKTVGEPVERGEPLAYLHCSTPSRIDGNVKASLLAAYEIGEKTPMPRNIILDVIRGDGSSQSGMPENGAGN